MQKILLYIILTVLAVAFSIPECACKLCRRNEIFVECASPCAEEPTCQNRNPTTPAICIDRCDQRCECKDGYIRSKPNGKCMKIENCPSECGVNEIFNECASPCVVEPTCNDKNPTTPSTCILRCDQRCECQPGYIRISSKGPCIKAEECECGLNEIFNECASPCDVEPTCTDQNPTTPIECIKRCDQRCECQPGCIRMTPQGPCIRIEECK